MKSHQLESDPDQTYVKTIDPIHSEESTQMENEHDTNEQTKLKNVQTDSRPVLDLSKAAENPNKATKRIIQVQD